MLKKASVESSVTAASSPCPWARAPLTSPHWAPPMWKSQTLKLRTLPQSRSFIWGGNTADRPGKAARVTSACTLSSVREVQVQDYQALIKLTNIYCKGEHQRLDIDKGFDSDWTQIQNLCTALTPTLNSAACLAGVRLGAILGSPARTLASEDTVLKTHKSAGSKNGRVRSSESLFLYKSNEKISKNCQNLFFSELCKLTKDLQ